MSSITQGSPLAATALSACALFALAGCGASDSAPSAESPAPQPPATAAAPAEGSGSGSDSSADAVTEEVAPQPMTPNDASAGAVNISNASLHSGPAGAPAGAALPPTCSASSLSAYVTGTDGAAGSQYLTVTMSSHSPEPCALVGFPGVSLVAAETGPQIGAAADRTGGLTEPVTLEPGGTAVFDVKVTQAGNYDAERCRPEPAAGLRIYPPGETAAVFMPDGVLTGCANDEVHLLSVSPVRPG